MPLAGTAARLGEIHAAMQKDLLEKARAFVAANTTRVSTWDEFKQVMAEKRGFIVAGWNGDAAIEAKIKEETKATIRVMPMGDPIEADLRLHRPEGPRGRLRAGVLTTSAPFVGRGGRVVSPFPRPSHVHSASAR